MEKDILTLDEVLHFWSENKRDLMVIKTILVFCKFKGIKLDFGTGEIGEMAIRLQSSRAKLENDFSLFKAQCDLKMGEKKDEITNVIKDKDMLDNHLKRLLDELNKQ